MLYRFFPAVKYFLFLAINWNIKIAWLLVRNDWEGDTTYHIETSGYDKLKHLEKAGVDISHATIYMPAPYLMLDMFFEKAGVKNCQHFLDIGSGKGRALFVANAYGAKKVTGVELSSKLLNLAKKNIVSFQQFYPGKKIILKHDDAWYFEIENDVDIIFLFNPFDEILLEQVVENIDKSLEESPRTIRIIYFNPLYKDVFLASGYSQIYYWKKMSYLEGVILQKEI